MHFSQRSVSGILFEAGCFFAAQIESKDLRVWRRIQRQVEGRASKESTKLKNAPSVYQPHGRDDQECFEQFQIMAIWNLNARNPFRGSRIEEVKNDVGSDVLHRLYSSSTSGTIMLAKNS